MDYCLPYSSNIQLTNPDTQSQFNRTSGVAKVGNGWAQAQPVMSSAQPIFMVYCAINMHTFPHQNI